jgi:hypothetical protein
MKIEALLDDDAEVRERALAACATAPAHERSALAASLVAHAKAQAAAFVAAEEATVGAEGARLRRLCLALSRMRVESAKKCLLRLADEGTPALKSLLADALRESGTTEGRAVLVHLLSDDDARTAAIVAIAAAPWPEVLQVLLELAETDDRTARLAVHAIARCGASSGVDESCAAADFLFELLDDEELLPDAFDAVLRFGHAFPGLLDKARRLAKESGRKKIAGICLFAAWGTDGTADLLELALGGPRADPEIARAFLEPLRGDATEIVRSAVERTWRVLDLR